MGLHDDACVPFAPLKSNSYMASLIRWMQVSEAGGGKLNGYAEPRGFTTEWTVHRPVLWRGTAPWHLMPSISNKMGGQSTTTS